MYISKYLFSTYCVLLSAIIFNFKASEINCVSASETLEIGKCSERIESMTTDNTLLFELENDLKIRPIQALQVSVFKDNQDQAKVVLFTNKKNQGKLLVKSTTFTFSPLFCIRKKFGSCLQKKQNRNLAGKERWPQIFYQILQLSITKMGLVSIHLVFYNSSNLEDYLGKDCIIIYHAKWTFLVNIFY